MNEVLAIIPARGGSKSIPKKNLAMLGGKRLVEYVMETALKTSRIGLTVCSTDDDEIQHICRASKIMPLVRHTRLAKDDTPIFDVVRHVLLDLEAEINYKPWAVALLQPTSPFMLPSHIDQCISALEDSKYIQSAQTVTTMPHNHHAYNQRIIIDGVIKFRFRDERVIGYNKQAKPKLYAFGNVIVTKVEALKQQQAIFACPSFPIMIPHHYAIDVDMPEDLELAEWYLKEGKVVL